MSAELQALLDEVVPARTTTSGSSASLAGSVQSSSTAYTTAQRALGVPRPTGQTWPSGAKRGIAEVKYTHDAMIDLLIAQPWISQEELARHFGYTASWISQVIASDSFQSRLAERRDKLIDPVLAAQAEERFKALVLRSQEILMEKLNRPAEEVPDQLALRALELSSRAAGYGARTEPPLGVNVSVHLETLGENLVGLLRRKKSEVINAEIEE